jgi:DNA-binding response OmpR family regulator
MARVLILHPDRSARKRLEHHARDHHQITVVSDLRAGMRAMTKFQPQVVVVGLSAKKTDAFEFLRYQQRNGPAVPTIVVASSDAGSYQPLAMKLGAAAFLEYPLERAALDEAISKVTTAAWQAKGEQPPVTEEEAQANLTELEADLNRRMQCFAGKNLVYIQSFILGGGQTSKPRIALKCPLRQQYGDPPNVYYEYIRDVCCSNPSACTAHQTFKAKHPA